MKKSKIYIVILLSTLTLSNIFAQRFDCKYIESLYSSMPSQLIETDSYFLNGFKVKVDSLNGTITNVGVQVANIENLSDSLLVSFIERKLLEIMIANNRHDLINVLDHSKTKLIFNGDDYIIGPIWDLKEGLNIVRENETMLVYRDSLNYSIQWGKGNDKFAMYFPANIQAITSKDKAELEVELADLLTANYNFTQKGISIDVTNLEEKEEGVYIKAGRNFILDNITNNIYFQKDKQGQYELIYSPDYIAETLANLFYFPLLGNNNITLEIQHKRYANKTSDYILSISQLINFCQMNSLIPYIGIESVKEELLEATVILHSEKYNYIHLLHVRTNTESLMNSSNAVIYFQMYSYINTDNVTNLFNTDYKESNNKYHK